MPDSLNSLVPEAKIQGGVVQSHRTGANVLRFVEGDIETPAARVTNTGPVELHETEALYLGPAGVEGEWRIARSGNDLVMQRLEAVEDVLSWVTKSTVAAAGS